MLSDVVVITSTLFSNVVITYTLFSDVVVITYTLFSDVVVITYTLFSDVVITYTLLFFLFQNGVMQGVLNILLLNISAYITKELGMAPGGEFRVAFNEVSLFGISSLKRTLLCSGALDFFMSVHLTFPNL